MSCGVCMFKRFILIVLVASLTGCATEGYRVAESECSYKGFSQYPVNNVSQVVTQNIALQVPTGQTVCNSMSMGYGYPVQTVCNQVTRTEYRPYQQNVVSDANAANRNSYIRNCAQMLCYQRFGNHQCESN